MKLTRSLTHTNWLVAVTGALAVNSVASATLTSPLWARPETDANATLHRSTYQKFDIFGDEDFDAIGVQDSEPDVYVNPAGAASVNERAGGFVTGNGNIYSPSVLLDMNVSVPGYAPVPAARTRFLVQFETLGSELVINPDGAQDFSTFKVNGTPIESLRDFSYREISRVPSMGATVEHAFTFTLPTMATDYLLTYQTLDTSCSQSVISIDTFVAISGDFDYDGDRDVADVDLLLRTTVGSTPPALSLFDVNLDDRVLLTRNTVGSDLDAWVHGLEQTEYGDANLDRKVDFGDLVLLAQSYGQSPSGWAHGDFDGSNLVGFEDLVTLAQNYGFGTAGAVSADDLAADWTRAIAAVPEPASIAVTSSLVLTLRRRRSITGSR